jgi:prepilin-type N-terminal cleavage/methylation domain-containing protein
MYSFPSPTTGEGTKGWGFKKKFHSFPSPLGRGLGWGFTLVELIVVVTILAILWTISFIALQWYSQDARDSKKISDVRSLISKITIENAKWISYSEIMNENRKETNSLTINWEQNKEWYQNIDAPINREILRENEENFRDPTNNHPYPFAYATWEANGQKYNFIQLAYVSEKTGTTKLVWNYYKMLPWDSPSLFTNENWNWSDIYNDYITDNWEPIYDIWVPYTYVCVWNISQNTIKNNTTWLTKNTSWQNTNSSNSCYYECSVWYSWENCEIFTISPSSSCTSKWQLIIAEWSYFVNTDEIKQRAWLSDSVCNSPDIIMCTWIWEWLQLSACNVWANTAWAHTNCVNSNRASTLNSWDCTTAKMWLHFQWWVNTWYKLETYYTMPNPIWYQNKIWKEVAQNEPCWIWYHIPSPQEWYDLVEAWITWWHWTWSFVSTQTCINGQTNWCYTNNNWNTWYYTWSSMDDFRTKLKLPATGYRRISPHAIIMQGEIWYYWSSISSSSTSKNSYELSFDPTKIIPSSFDQRPPIAFSIRCFKD